MSAAGFLLCFPEGCGGQFDAVSRWIPKIDGMTPMGPDDLLFDGDSFLIEPLFPGGNEGFIDLKGHMHRSSRTMGRKSMVCLLCFPGIEQKEHPFATVEKDMPLFLLAIQLKTEEI